MRVFSSTEHPAEVFMDMSVPAGTRIRMGRIAFREGERIPESGTSLHDQAEYSYVVSGSIAVTSGGATATAKTGDLIKIPPGEGHFTQVLTDTAVVYLLVG